MAGLFLGVSSRLYIYDIRFVCEGILGVSTSSSWRFERAIEVFPTTISVSLCTSWRNEVSSVCGQKSKFWDNKGELCTCSSRAFNGARRSLVIEDKQLSPNAFYCRRATLLCNYVFIAVSSSFLASASVSLPAHPSN
jgi:hypothetical protein